MSVAVQEPSSQQTKNELPRFSYGRDSSGLHAPLGSTRFLARCRETAPFGPKGERPTVASMITPCVVPVFRPDQKLGARLKTLLHARDTFKAVCEEIGAPGWAMPDLFRVFLVSQESKNAVAMPENDLVGGVWCGNRLTAHRGLRTKALALEAALRAADPGAEVTAALAVLDPAYSFEEQVVAREVSKQMRQEEDAKDDDARRFLAQAHLQVLHPTPFKATSADTNGMSLIVEALRRVTEACDLELYAMGFGEIAFGMIRLAGGKSFAAPVYWPLDGTQVSCLVPLDHDNLAYLIANTWACRDQADVYGLREDDFRISTSVMPETLRALEANRARLGVALATKPATHLGGGIWGQPRDRQWADVGAGDLILDLILEDKQAGTTLEEVKAWEDYWAIRGSFLELVRQVAAIEDAPKQTRRSETLSKDAWKVQVGRGNAALNFEVKLLENNGAGGFEDDVEHGIQARLLNAYAPRALARLAEQANLKVAAQVDPLKMAIAALVLDGVQPVVPLGVFFPPLGACLSDEVLPLKAKPGPKALSPWITTDEKTAPLGHLSPDGLWLYLFWGSEDDGSGHPATGYFQAVSGQVGNGGNGGNGGASLLEGAGEEATQMGERILAQMESFPGAGIAPAGRWLMLAREPFFA